MEVLRQLKDKYKGLANFIHVDFYENPDEIQGDLRLHDLEFLDGPEDNKAWMGREETTAARDTQASEQ